MKKFKAGDRVVLIRDESYGRTEKGWVGTFEKYQKDHSENFDASVSWDKVKEHNLNVFSKDLRKLTKLEKALK